MLESLAAASYDGRLYSLSFHGSQRAHEGQLQTPGSPHARLREAHSFLQSESKAVLRSVGRRAALLRAASSPQRSAKALQRDALEAASCVLRTSTESIVLSKAA